MRALVHCCSSCGRAYLRYLGSLPDLTLNETKDKCYKHAKMKKICPELTPIGAPAH